MPYLGELTALGAAACWSVTSLLFAFGVAKLGAFTLNQVRLGLAAVALWLIVGLVYGSRGALAHASSWDLILLVASGAVGLALGDWAYYAALHLLGPRLATLTMALAPPVTTLLGLAFLGEKPSLSALAGMTATIFGVVWVLLERTKGGAPVPRGHRLKGALLGLLAAIGQAVGLIVSKQALQGGMPTLSATAIRMTAAAIIVWVGGATLGRSLSFAPLAQDRRLCGAILVATLLGPVLGIWLVMVAVRHAQAGIVATLSSTVPILVIPLVVFVRKERVTARAALGATVAVIGVAVLFLPK